jgi:predicted AAA+ superfamily ATPase
MVKVRVCAEALRAHLHRSPAVAILGSRQIGKSTLARTAFPDFHFLDLEDKSDFDRVAADPAFILTEHSRIVLDEAQRLPALFPALRVHLDRNPKSRVVLLGSASPSLFRGISESLTGRVTFFDLAGVSILEEDATALWVRGSFPRIHWARPRPYPAEWYAAYLRSVLEQDIPQLGYRLPAARLWNLLTMIAHGQGGVCNLSEIGGSLGVTYHTVADTLDLLDGVFLVRRLRPFFANIGKRLVKSPKLYLRDTGILHALLGVEFTKKALYGHPKAGASFETFCIEQIIAHARLADPRSEAFFYRTQTGVEVDLVLRLRGKIVAIEVKLGVTPPPTRAIEICMSDLSIQNAFVVSMTREPLALRPGIEMVNLGTLLKRLRLIPSKP